MVGGIAITVGWLSTVLFDDRHTRTAIGRDTQQDERQRAFTALEP